MTPDQLARAESIRVLITGGRHYDDAKVVARVLGRLSQAKRIETIIHGDATGADLLADTWAALHGVPCLPFPVREDLDGTWPAAGPRRNSRMLREGRPDIAVAFPGGNGTADMSRKVLGAGLGLLRVAESGWAAFCGPAASCPTLIGTFAAEPSPGVEPLTIESVRHAMEEIRRHERLFGKAVVRVEAGASLLRDVSQLPRRAAVAGAGSQVNPMLSIGHTRIVQGPTLEADEFSLVFKS